MPTTPPPSEGAEVSSALREMRSDQRVMEARFNTRMNEMADALLNMEVLLKQAVSKQDAALITAALPQPTALPQPASLPRPWVSKQAASSSKAAASSSSSSEGESTTAARRPTSLYRPPSGTLRASQAEPPARFEVVVEDVPPASTPQRPRAPPKVQLGGAKGSAAASSSTAPAAVAGGRGVLGGGGVVLGKPWKAWRVLCCAFTIGQAVLGCLVGAAIVYGIFTLLLLGGDEWSISDGHVLMVLILSPILGSVFAPMFTPIALPEMAEKGWIGAVDPERLPCCVRCLPFLRAKHAIVRHVILAALISSLWIPAGVYVLTGGSLGALGELTPPHSRTTICIFASVYNASISALVIPLGMLGFGMRPNFERAVGMMSMDDDKLRRLFWRVVYVPLC